MSDAVWAHRRQPTRLPHPWDSPGKNTGVGHWELDTLKWEVKWALGSITTNKASGGDGIPVELFQILDDDIVKVLHSVCQQIWKTQPWPQDWKRSIFIPIPKKSNAKECSNCHTVALISQASIHWRRKRQPTPIFLPGESQGWGSLVGCRLWGCTESDTTEAIWQQQQQQQQQTAY